MPAGALHHFCLGHVVGENFAFFASYSRVTYSVAIYQNFLINRDVNYHHNYHSNRQKKLPLIVPPLTIRNNHLVTIFEENFSLPVMKLKLLLLKLSPTCFTIINVQNITEF